MSGSDLPRWHRALLCEPRGHEVIVGALLEEPDPAIYAWAIGREPVPAEHDNAVMALLRRFAADMAS